MISKRSQRQNAPHTWSHLQRLAKQVCSWERAEDSTAAVVVATACFSPYEQLQSYSCPGLSMKCPERVGLGTQGVVGHRLGPGRGAEPGDTANGGPGQQWGLHN